MLATATFALKHWDEKPYDEADGAAKLTRASVLYGFDGEMAGEGRLEYLMAYLPDASALFIGYQRFVGRVGNREGTFIFQHGGRFAAGVATDTWKVMPGSGTGGLAGISGQVEFSAAHAERYEINIEYDIAKRPRRVGVGGQSRDSDPGL
jgi:hypothetical protein